MNTQSPRDAEVPSVERPTGAYSRRQLFSDWVTASRKRKPNGSATLLQNPTRINDRYAEVIWGEANAWVQLIEVPRRWRLLRLGSEGRAWNMR
jgi:hypothetical protein